MAKDHGVVQFWLHGWFCFWLLQPKLMVCEISKLLQEPVGWL
jgi:hypothetical protein